LPGVACPPSCRGWFGATEGRDVEMAEPRVGRDIGHCGACPRMSPRWLRVFRRAWWALVGWSARFPVGYGPTGSGGRQPGTQGSGSGEHSGRSRRWRCPWGASVAPPPLVPPGQPASAASAESREHSQRPGHTGHCARLSTLIATPSTPDGVRPAEHQALSALRAAETAHGCPPATRTRVVLLPHAQIEPTNPRPHKRRTGRTTGMNQDGFPQQYPTHPIGDNTPRTWD
jgi:hypothetical protein